MRGTGPRGASRVAAGCVVALVLCAASPIRAAPSKRAQAEARFEQAARALERGELDLACTKFRESQALDPANGTLYNLATCEERRGRLATALALFEELLRMLPKADARATEVYQRIVTLEPRVPRLRIELSRSAPADIEVEFDGAVLPESALGVARPVDPGTHTIVARSNDGARTFEVALSPGQQDTLVVEVGTSAPPAATALATQESSAAGAREDKIANAGAQKTFGLALVSVGVVGIVVGSYAGLRVISAEGELDALCTPEHLCRREDVAEAKDIASSGRTMSIVSTVGFVAGVAALGAGITLYLTSSDAERGAAAHARAWRLRAGASARDSYVGLERRF